MATGRVPTTANSPLTVKGDLFTFSTASAKLAVGANDTVLVADSTQSTGLAYKTKGVFNGLTTTGDTIYSSSGTTQARLGIGSTGQVLTVTGGVPTWATPASSAFLGVRAGRNTNQSLANATVTVITWEYETYDTDGLWTSSPNPTRITVPSGQGGYYLCIAQIHFGTNVNGFRTCTLRINGSDTRTQTEIGTSSRGSSVYAIDILNLSAGDYIEVQGYQDSGGSLNAIGDSSNDYTYITVQKVG